MDMGKMFLILAIPSKPCLCLCKGTKFISTLGRDVLMLCYLKAYNVTAFVLMITENKSVTVFSTSVHQKGLLL